jgi:hypothetical protein
MDNNNYIPKESEGKGKGESSSCSLPFLLGENINSNNGQREAYCINYSCQVGSWQPKEMSAKECLSNEESNRLDDILIKLLNNGVLLAISYSRVSDILGHSDSPKVTSSC